MGLGAMILKGYSAFVKSSRLELRFRLSCAIIWGGGSYRSTVMLSVYFTAPRLTKIHRVQYTSIYIYIYIYICIYIYIYIYIYIKIKY